MTSQNFTIPHQNQTPEVGSCYKIYWNLHEMMQNKDIPASFFIRELFQTVRCDNVKDFKELRSRYHSFIDEQKADSFNKIMTLQGDANTEEAAVQTFLHYQTWTAEELFKAFPFNYKLYYHTWHRSEKLFAFVGIVTTGIWGMNKGSKVVRASLEKIRKQRSDPKA